MSGRTVAIVGAGIAGLTTALCLARKGISSHILEQADSLEEVGAGLQVSPNASFVLSALGVLPALERQWIEPERIVLASGRNLRTLAEVPAGRDARHRWHQPYGILHRATLQRALLDAVAECPLAHLQLGMPVERYDREAIGAVIGTRPDLTIAADGVWSKMRASVPGAATARFSGHVAWRFMVPFEGAPELLHPRRVTAWVGPHAHLVAYPLHEAEAFNIVAIHKSVSGAHGWSHPSGDAGMTLRTDKFASWNGDIVKMLQQAAAPQAWPLYQCGDGRWFDDEALLLTGDAAHATTPFAAQGAAMAIEDAAELAEAIANASRSQRRFPVSRRAAGSASAGSAPAPISTASPIMPAGRSRWHAMPCWRCAARKASPPISTGSTVSSEDLRLSRARPLCP